MATEATPRINSRYLETFLHQTVRIVGKVSALHGETATLDADGPVTIHLNRVRSLGFELMCAATVHVNALMQLDPPLTLRPGCPPAGQQCC